MALTCTSSYPMVPYVYVLFRNMSTGDGSELVKEVSSKT